VTDRATSFGTDASRYNAVRPGYPSEIVERVASPGDAVLDVGAGTGLAGCVFADRGFEVVGVEPDTRMAEVAPSRGLSVECARFEDWDANGRHFDVVICAQAWWWLDRVVAIPKIAELLRPGGRLAVFWNSGGASDPVTVELAETYERIGGGSVREPMLPGGFRPGVEDELLSSPFFVDVATELFEWNRRYSRDEWIEAACTFSDVIGLTPEVRDELLTQARDVIDRHGGHRDVAVRTTLVTATRTA
jgi:SAM-dependent methyltransferase